MNFLYFAGALIVMGLTCTWLAVGILSLSGWLWERVINGKKPPTPISPAELQEEFGVADDSEWRPMSWSDPLTWLVALFLWPMLVVAWLDGSASKMPKHTRGPR
ncbi:MAG: hypothetical protein AAGB29_05975 [Planctomycetota bacterium]